MLLLGNIPHSVKSKASAHPVLRRYTKTALKSDINLGQGRFIVPIGIFFRDINHIPNLSQDRKEAFEPRLKTDTRIPMRGFFVLAQPLLFRRDDFL
jgi:hypothetical protein